MKTPIKVNYWLSLQTSLTEIVFICVVIPFNNTCRKIEFGFFFRICPGRRRTLRLEVRLRVSDPFETIDIVSPVSGNSP